MVGRVEVLDTHDTHADGRRQRVSTVRFENDKMPSTAVTTELDERWADMVAPGPGYLIPTLLVLAARLGDDLRLEGPVDPDWADACRDAHALQASWWGWRPAELHITEQRIEPPSGRGRGLCFTCGVDSWSALLSLLDGPADNRPTHLVTMDGDAHLPEDLRAARLAHVVETAERIDIPLVVIRSDLRATIDPHTNWGRHTHGGALAGFGHMLSHGLERLTIAPTNWWPDATPYGSHPGLDPRWSSPTLTVDHPGADEPRFRRVRRVAHDPLAVATLQVCWDGMEHHNCGRCTKCLQTMSGLMLSGQAGWEERFAAPFDPDAIAALGPLWPAGANGSLEMCDEAGLRADSLRQRWEAIGCQDDPAITYRHAARQPRVPVTVDGSAPAPEQALSIGVALAAHGLRVDHGHGGEQVLDRHPLDLRDTDGTWTDATGHSLDELAADGDLPVDTALAFDPEHQVAEVAEWTRLRQEAVGWPLPPKSTPTGQPATEASATESSTTVPPTPEAQSQPESGLRRIISRLRRP